MSIIRTKLGPSLSRSEVQGLVLSGQSGVSGVFAILLSAKPPLRHPLVFLRRGLAPVLLLPQLDSTIAENAPAAAFDMMGKGVGGVGQAPDRHDEGRRDSRE